MVYGMEYEHLDSLQCEVYDNLDQLLRIHNDESIDDVRLDQAAVLKRITHLLLSYKDYLGVVVGHVDKNDSEQQAQLAMYQAKLKALRMKVRTFQIRANDLDAQLVHKKRLAKFARKKPLDNASARDQLFANTSTKDKEASTASVNSQILSHNKQITSSLQATRQLLSTTVLQSELNIDSLDQQTQDLHKLNDEFIKFSDLLAKSRNIVKFIEKQDKADRNRIYLSVGFFMLCCAWVIWRRILRTPVRLMLWSFFKMFGIFSWFFSVPNTLKGDSVTSMATNNMGTSTLGTSTLGTSTLETLATSVASVVTAISSASFDFEQEFAIDIDDVTSVVSAATHLMDEL